MIVLHADWGKDPRKRWIARARQVGERWEIDDLRLWGGEGSPFECLGLDAAEESPVLIGVDFPIGLPRAYAAAAGVSDFRATLPLFGGPGWEHFYEVARTADEISLARPFYPAAPGGTRRRHLLEGLGLPIAHLYRACEAATATRPAACPLFWTLGANQVGKGAIAGWRELVAPLVSEGAALWPFDGELADLVAAHRVTIAETYPAEYYAPLGFGPARWSKRRQGDRVARAPTILEGSVALGATLAPWVAGLIEAGFGDRPEGEDPFDAVVGLLGVLMALRDRATAPGDAAIRTVEGWVLGLPAGSETKDELP